MKAKIMRSQDPAEQKKMGKKLEGFDDALWITVAERVALEGNWWKFTENGNEEMRTILLGTGEREICEVSRVDRRWGIGFRADEALGRREEWGQNLLGKALVRVRGKVRERMVEIKEGRRKDGDWEVDDVGGSVGERGSERSELTRG